MNNQDDEICEDDHDGLSAELFLKHQCTMLVQPNGLWPRDVVEILTAINGQIWDERMSLAVLCEDLRLAGGSIAGRFRRYVGVSPKQYVLKHRLAAATTLIDRLGISAAEAAAWVGFRHASSLRKALARKNEAGPVKSNSSK